MLSQFATSQEVYNYNLEWKGDEVIKSIENADSCIILNRTYSLARGQIFVWSDCMLDSVRMTYGIQSGLKEALKMQYDKGFVDGYHKGDAYDPQLLDIGFGVFMGSLVTWAIVTELGAEREP